MFNATSDDKGRQGDDKRGHGRRPGAGRKAGSNQQPEAARVTLHRSTSRAPAVNRVSTLNGRGQPVHGADGRGAACGAAFQGLEASGLEAHYGDGLDNRSALHGTRDGLPCVEVGLGPVVQDGRPSELGHDQGRSNPQRLATWAGRWRVVSSTEEARHLADAAVDSIALTTSVHKASGQGLREIVELGTSSLPQRRPAGRDTTRGGAHSLRALTRQGAVVRYSVIQSPSWARDLVQGAAELGLLDGFASPLCLERRWREVLEE
ncbi:hypothetical protein G7Z17_g11644 [Cylindrodendrum hubeiense]|uniref:Uncharacterized protein n=1 Tax=Cylindrodendrum hubeiense TaxID=595255 RepID=A0A9P5LB36_9HYPO|nr:hypothetical protein G7Z17_g11644 [Cylindrodendrum hubeiense]